MWERRFNRLPPGDNVTHRLLARIGFMLEHWIASEPPKASTWFFWENFDDEEEEQEGAPVNVDGEDFAADRALVRSMMVH